MHLGLNDGIRRLMIDDTRGAHDNLFLKTLFQVSRDLFEAKDADAVLQKFLLFLDGSLGVNPCFVAYDDDAGGALHFVHRGLNGDSAASLPPVCARFLRDETVPQKNGASYLPNPGKFPENVKALIPFGLPDHGGRGLVALGAKRGAEFYGEHDVELLLTLTQNLVAALRNSMFLRRVEKLTLDFQKKNHDLESAFQELDRRVYHLKTLNDISRDIFGTVEFGEILNHFLLMIMGNFGVMQGFAVTAVPATGDISFFKAMGCDDEESAALQRDAASLMRQAGPAEAMNGQAVFLPLEAAGMGDICVLMFQVTSDCRGCIGLGSKIIGEPFSEDDKELMATLVNSLVVSLKNALSFESIRRLNLDLQEKNVQLEKTLEALKVALRKVELLESIKANLSKFVPTAVTRLVENATSSEIHEAQEQDISVLFLDIEGYTRITDTIGATNVNTLIERYFSVFMDAIFANEGDVVETAGDGLMVLFLNAHEKENALQAVRAAQTIIQKACSINDECTLESERCLVNVGVASGKAFVGAAKFESITGSRWTYTTHGTIVNIAARLCGKAKGGEALVSGETVRRVKEDFAFTSLGKASLKNLSEPVDVFALQS